MQHDACTNAAIAKRVQPDPSNPRVVYRVWTPSDLSFIVLDVFIDGWMEEQHVHNPGDESYRFWREGLYSDSRYPAWQF